jgi:heme exporter protein CcmB
MTGLAATIRAAWRIAVWDLTCELRRPTSLTSVALFAAGALVTMRLAIAGGSEASNELAAGGLWVVLLFGALLGVGRSLAIEREEGTFDALLLSPADRSSIYLGKVLGAYLQSLAVCLVLVPLCWILLAAPPTPMAALTVAGLVAVASLGFAAVGVLGALLSLRARGRELLNAAIFVPLTVPLIVASVAATLGAWGVNSPDMQQLWAFILCYDGVFIAAGVAATPLLVVE